MVIQYVGFVSAVALDEAIVILQGRNISSFLSLTFHKGQSSLIVLEAATGCILHAIPMSYSNMAITILLLSFKLSLFLLLQVHLALLLAL